MEGRKEFVSGMYGLLIGDALGVPYEFHSASDIPPYEQIEMVPPGGFHRSHSSVEAGTWSDDGAQALCLLDSLVTCGTFCLEDFSNRLVRWYQKGEWAIEGVVFDIGIQTSEALYAYQKGMSLEQCGNLRPNGKGNGALMRVLPLALWHKGSDQELILDSHKQCLITHGHRCNQVCCALYCLTARYLITGLYFQDAVRKAVNVLRNTYQTMPEYEEELEWNIRPDEPWIGQGSGYVVDCLRSAFMIMEQASCYEDAVKQAIMLGDDTDTTACVTGGIAGIAFGYASIPTRWIALLKGKREVDQLLERIKD